MMRVLRRATLLAAAAATLAGCGRESHVRHLTALTPNGAKKAVKFFNSESCGPGQTFIRYDEPSVINHEGNEEGGWESWCVEPAQAYRRVALDVHCRPGTRLAIELARHRAVCAAESTPTPDGSQISGGFTITTEPSP